MNVQNLINKTAVKIFNIHKNKTFNKFSTCINEFYSKCSAESLRSTTMELIIKIHDILSGDEYFETICNIIKFHETVITENVPQNIWENAWKICIEIASQKTYARDSFDALNRLFHICKPETKERKALINKSIKEFLENQKTFYRGIRLIKYIMLLKMNFTTRHINFYSNFPVKSIRIVTMELIIKIFQTLSRIDKDVIYNAIKFISDNFKWTMENKGESFVKAVVSGNVPLKTWKNVWEICFKVMAHYKNIFSDLDHLFRISEPETKRRKFLINQSFRELLKKENTFERGLKWIKLLNVETLKEEILFSSFLSYGNYEKLALRFFSSPEEKFLTLQIFDDCLKRIERNKAPKSKPEEKFREIFSVETLAEMIQKRAKKYGIEIEEYNFYANKIFFIQKMKIAYDFMDKVYFELYVLEQLKDQDEKYKIDFLEVVSHDSKYANIWAKKLEISQENIPLYLQNNEHFKASAKIIPKEVSNYVEKDFIETCKFWEKSYKFFTVMTPEAFETFIFECFIKEKPKIIGIDCEADDNNHIALLQLATPKWICLIDIQTLFNQIPENKWEKFFERLFHPSILRIGFSFQNDYRFLCRNFPFLLNLFSQNLQKVSCLQALAISIFEKEIDSSSIFGSDFFSNSGLAKLSKSVLNITLDKSLQRSDWSKRPLTQLQKIYAISDALIVVLIYDKIETRLIKKLGYSDAEEDEHDGEFEKDLYDSVTSGDKQKLIKLIQDLCILDCDFFLDSISDYILQIFGNEEAEMDWNDIQIYLGLENDFSEKERKLIEKSEKLEYFLSLDTENFKFPFPNKSLYSLKTDFSTPMNCSISRIIQRSNEKVSYLFSLINKTIKNEVDRHPLKLTKFQLGCEKWSFNIYSKKIKNDFNFVLDSKNYDEVYFNIMKKNMVIAKDAITSYDKKDVTEPFLKNDSLSFVISKRVDVRFNYSNTSFYQFDSLKCPIPIIIFRFINVGDKRITFEDVYNHLIAKDLSNRIRIQIRSDMFNFFSGNSYAEYYKKSNASKFRFVEINGHRHIFQGFKTFVEKYMEDDGIIKSSDTILGIPWMGVKEVNGYYRYPVLDVKKYWDSVFTKQILHT